MTLKRNLAFMGLTTAVRVGAGLVTFTVLARVLGPQAFGTFALWLSVATLATILTNYGLVPYVLREIGMNPGATGSVIDEVFTAKLLLACLLFLIAGAAILLNEITDWRIFIFLLVAAVADCFSEFLGAGLRARDRFDIETRIVSASSVLHSLVMVVTVLIFRSVLLAAFAYSISRFLFAIAIFAALARYVARPRIKGVLLAARRLRRAYSYALDYGLQSLFGQIDSVVLNHHLGPAAVGSYQAGMRIYQTGAQALSVFSNVFLPRVAVRQGSIAAVSRENGRIQFVFITAGAVFGLALALFANIVVSTLLGAAYASLSNLLPLFGLLFFLRFAAAAWGILLTAAGHQQYRTACGFLYWIAIFLLAYWLVPQQGSRGWLLSLCMSTILLIIGYALRGRHLVEKAWVAVMLPLVISIPLLLIALIG